MERLGVEFAGPFVEQGGDHVGEARRFGGIRMAPPRKAKSTAISGTVLSCTSQASMPPGLITRSILVACASEVSDRMSVQATASRAKQVLMIASPRSASCP